MLKTTTVGKMRSQTNQQRALIALVEVLGLSVWFSATAVAPSLRSEWGISASAAVWPVRRHRAHRADRNRISADRCHHPTRAGGGRADRLALRVSASGTRPPDRCRGVVSATTSSTPPNSRGGTT
jgi:hypothetical protein